MFNNHNALANDGYTTRVTALKRVSSPGIIYAKKWVSVFATALFVAADAVCLYSTLNSLSVSNPFMIILITAVSAFVLDVPMAYAGWKYKSYQQGLESKHNAFLVMILAVVSFIVTLIFYFALRIVTRDLVFDVGASSTLTNSVSQIEQQTDTSASRTILIAAIFNGIIPLVTSLASFLVTFATTNELDDKINKIKTSKIRKQSNIIDLNVALTEAGKKKEHCKKLMSREKDMYDAHQSQIDMQIANNKQLARIIIMQKLNDPQAINDISESAREINQEVKGNLTVPINSISFIENSYINNQED